MVVSDGSDMGEELARVPRFGDPSHFDTVQILVLYQVGQPTKPFDTLLIVWPSAALVPL